jgi:hypothetical protein
MFRSYCRTLVITVMVGMSNVASAATSLDPFFNKSATGQELANAFLGLIMMTGSPTGQSGNTPQENESAREIIKPYLNNSFITQRSSGERFNKNNYVPSDIDNFQIDKLAETRPTSDIRVIRYIVKTNKLPTTQAGVVLSDNWAPRLTVLKWNRARSQWQVVSHSNFNFPIAAICESHDAKGYPLKTDVSERDFKIGSDLANKWFKLLENGSGRPLMNSQIQAQSANGNGYTTASQYKPGKISKVTLTDIAVSRDRELLVVSLNAKIDSTLYANSEKLSSKKNPRLLTFLKAPSGRWEMIAAATFNPPVEIPAGSKCN